MNKQEFNRLAAEFLGKVSVGFRADGVEEFLNDRGGSQPFNPYDDANDLYLLEEKLEIYTLPPDGNEGWRTMMRKANIKGIGKTPHESRRACAEEYLKERKK